MTTSIQLKKSCLLLITLLFSISILAQNSRRITGSVTDETQNAIENIQIIVKGTSIRTQTDAKGSFTFEAKNNQDIVIITNSHNTVSAIREIPRGDADFHIHIILSPKQLSLPEVDIVGARPQSYHSSITYSATRLDIPVLEIPSTVETVTRKLLEDQQAVSMSEALRNFGGLTTASAGEAANINEVFVSRGFSMTNSRNYFRNGIRYLKFSNNSLSNIERIEMLKGPASVLYGAVEPGGVVNFITKPTLYTPKYGASVRYGSYNYKQVATDLTGPMNANNTIRFRLNGMYEDADNFRKPVESKRYSITPLIDFDLGSKTTLSVDADIFRDKRTHDSGVLHFDGKIIDNGYKTFLGEPWAYGKFNDVNFGYQLTHKFNKNWTGRSFFRQYFTHEDRLYFQMKTPQKDNTITRRLANWDAKINYRNYLNELTGNFNTGKIVHKVLVGLEYGYLTNRRNVEGVMYTPISYINPVYSDKPENLKMDKSTDLYITQRTYALYLQDQITLSDQWKLLLGGRADWIDDKNDNRKTAKIKKEHNFAISPRVGLVYIPIKDLSIYSSFSQSYVPQSGETKEGDSFKPVRSKQWELGVKKSFFNDRLISTVAVYNLEKVNLPTTDPEDEDYKIQIGKQYSRGVEIGFTGDITRNWSVAMNYAYTYGKVSKTNDKKYPVGTKLANLAPHRFNIWTSYQIKDGTLKGLSTGAGFSFTDTAHGNLLNNIELDAFKTVDYFIAYQYKFAKLSVNFKNIFNEEYFIGAQGTYLLNPGMPRTVLAQLSVNF